MTNNTQDTELLDLCKQVYEATGWDDDSLRHWLGGNIHQKRLFESDIYLNNTTEDTYVPLYNSDYLLEKLPAQLEQGELFVGKWGKSYWRAGYFNYKPGWSDLRDFSDTPLKALLKLTLALHKEGLL